MAETVFTLEDFLKAAEQNKFPNQNETYIRYKNWDGYGHTLDNSTPKGPVVSACVIGEAFINLGFTENGVTAFTLSQALNKIPPDAGVLTITHTEKLWDGKSYKPITIKDDFKNLADFINDLNSYPGWRGKKRIVALVRKHFSKSLDTVIDLEVVNE